jgi:hypothetical protein
MNALTLPDGVTVPPVAKLRSHWKYLLRSCVPETHRELTATPHSFSEFARSHDYNSILKEDGTVDKDKPYVCGYEMIIRDPVSFRMCFSTERLLNFVPNRGGPSDSIHSDDTADVVWNKFPVLTMGFTDMNRVYHPVMVALCSTKTEWDYSFMFETYKKYRPTQIIK